MAWFFTGLVMLMLGATTEGYGRRSPGLWPSNILAKSLWMLLGKMSAVLLLVLIAGSLLVFPWWVALLQFVVAFIVQLAFVSTIMRLGALPGISMSLMIIGGALSVFGILNPEVAMF